MGDQKNKYVIGIDVGTTSIKGVLLNAGGEAVCFTQHEYQLDYKGTDRCELDPEIYWNTSSKSIRDLLSISKADPDSIVGISFSSQGETIIFLDKVGKPLCNAMVWLDNRSEMEAKEIESEFGQEKILKITGQPEVVPTWPATKILWMKKNHPEIFSKTDKFLLVEDYLIYRLTGQFHTEYSMASSTLYFNIEEKSWWPEMLNFLSVSESQLPELHPSGKVIAQLTDGAARETGLNKNTLSVTGAYDHPAGAIGSGNLKAGDITLTIGGSMAMCVSLDNPVLKKTLNLSCQCHAVDNLYFLLPYGQTAGLVLKWLKDEFYKDEAENAKDNNKDIYDLIAHEAGKVSIGSDGLIMLPHLMGAGSPEFNSNIRGVFAGIKLGTTRAHFARAILESVACMINRNVQIIKESNIPIGNLHVLGGGSRSDIWMQILADMLAMPVYIQSESNNAVLGAAFLAGVGTGLFESLESACAKFDARDKVFYPDENHGKKYQEVYQGYVKLYDAMKTYW